MSNLKLRIRTVLKQYVQNRERYYNGRGYKRMNQMVAIRKINSHLEYYQGKSTRAYCIMMKQVGHHIATLKPEKYEDDRALKLYDSLERLQKEAHLQLHENNQINLPL